jgi:hypothetical protein
MAKGKVTVHPLNAKPDWRRTRRSMIKRLTKATYKPPRIRDTMRSIARVRERAGRCYELSCRVMLEEEGAEDFILVHGRLRWMPHAWIELPSGTVYDASLGDAYARDIYHADRRYTRREVMQAVLETGHSGPWDDAELAAIKGSE